MVESWRPPPSFIRFMHGYWDTIMDVPETEWRQFFRLLVHVRNASPKGIRLAELFDRGEIDSSRMLELADCAQRRVEH